MVDPDRVRRLVASIQRWHGVLAAAPSDPYRRRYAVQSAAQACIDLANHVISSEGWRVPADYGDAFTVLAEEGVLSEGLSARLRAMAGLRNLLVHLYDEIDDARVADSASEGLVDIDEFVQAVTALL